MKIAIALLALAFLSAVGAQAQIFDGVNAPDAVTMRITQVIVTGKPETVVKTQTPGGDGLTVFSTITESTSGYDVVGESATIRYKISCLVSHSVEDTSYMKNDFAVWSQTVNTFVDGKESSWSQAVPLTDSSVSKDPTAHHGVVLPPLHPGDVSMVQQRDDTNEIVNHACEQFHVGMTVVFYSIDHLIWLSKTDASGSTFVHGNAWRPVGRNAYPLATASPSPTNPFWDFVVLSENGLIHEIEKPYTLEAEEEKPAPKKMAPTPNKKSKYRRENVY